MTDIEPQAESSLCALSLGAGVQSTTLALLAVEGVLPKPDVAVFADTGWEPRGVYEHLDRLAQVLADADIELVRVSKGNLREDMLAGRDWLSIPAFVKSKNGDAVPIRRQCTGDYKLDPIVRYLKQRLGAKTSSNGSVLPPPPGRTVEQWIGFSADEIGRVKPSQYKWITNVYPLLDLVGAGGRQGWTRDDCRRWLTSKGWGDTPRSACIGCPLHGNAAWRRLRDERPDEWADAVEFDAELRRSTVRSGAGTAYLHRSLLPLDQAPIDRVTRKEWNDRQTEIFDFLEQGDPDGCSPFGCRSGLPIDSVT